MSEHEPSAIRCHEDPEFFREAVNFTAAETAFGSRLIEKDYFCSVILNYLAARDRSLIFKGGTCLAKVYADFYRLSEDLDFVMSVESNLSRTQRSRSVAGVKKVVAELPAAFPGISVVQPLKGANSSAQYLGVLNYTSLLSRQKETIKIEIGLREPLILPSETGQAKTILLDPITHKPMVLPIKPTCISKAEAFAEKFRAALTRREVAIRDFFDIDYAVRRLDLRPQDDGMVRLVRAKLAVSGTEPLNVSDARFAELRHQLQPQLRPVLRQQNFREFDVERAIGIVRDMAARVAQK